jgi:ATP-binding cassette, subfamily B (MDR/TAP), member 1
MTVTFGAQGAGQFFSFSPDLTKAISATANVTRLLEHEPDIDVLNREGKVVEQLEAGHIEFRNVHFSYPTRFGHKISCSRK